MLFEMIVGQNFQLIFKRHLEWPVASGLKNRDMFERALKWNIKSRNGALIKSGAIVTSKQ